MKNEKRAKEDVIARSRVGNKWEKFNNNLQKHREILQIEKTYSHFSYYAWLLYIIKGLKIIAWFCLITIIYDGEYICSLDLNTWEMKNIEWTAKGNELCLTLKTRLRMRIWLIYNIGILPLFLRPAQDFTCDIWI